MYFAYILTGCSACSYSKTVLWYSGSYTLVGRMHLVCTCKSQPPHYQATLIFVQQYLRHTYVCIHVWWDAREASDGLNLSGTEVKTQTDDLPNLITIGPMGKPQNKLKRWAFWQGWHIPTASKFIFTLKVIEMQFIHHLILGAYLV